MDSRKNSPRLASSLNARQENITQLEDVTTALLQWFNTQGRSFSWRKHKDPFYILIAEILLRKTGANAVEQYLPQFFAVYPSAREIAAANLEDLTSILAPLGLGEQRARQFLELARRIEADFGGKVPSEMAYLLTLPGIGRYTAGMVASTCFQAPVPAVDTNVARVLLRVFGITPSHAEPRKSRNVWELAAALICLHQDDAAKLTWSLLDLGATICLARIPRCEVCPLQRYCVLAQNRNQKVV